MELEAHRTFYIIRLCVCFNYWIPGRPPPDTIRQRLLRNAHMIWYLLGVSPQVYNVIYPRLYGASRPFLAAWTDVLTNNPFVYFPGFYVCKSFAYASMSTWLKRPKQIAVDGLTSYRTNFWSDAKTAVLFWLPCHTFNFRLVPLHFRMPFMAAIGLIWATLLSARSGSEPSVRSIPQQPAVTAQRLAGSD